MSTPHYQIIKRPIITEKGLGVKELQHTVEQVAKTAGSYTGEVLKPVLARAK